MPRKIVPIAKRKTPMFVKAGVAVIYTTQMLVTWQLVSTVMGQRDRWNLKLDGSTSLTERRQKIRALLAVALQKARDIMEV